MRERCYVLVCCHDAPSVSHLPTMVCVDHFAASQLFFWLFHSKSKQMGDDPKDGWPPWMQIAAIIASVVSLVCCVATLWLFTLHFKQLHGSMNFLLMFATMSLTLVYALYVTALIGVQVDGQPLDSTCTVMSTMMAAFISAHYGFLGGYYVQIAVVWHRGEHRAVRAAKLFTAIVLIVTVTVTVFAALENHKGSPIKGSIRHLCGATLIEMILPGLFQIVMATACVFVVAQLWLCTNIQRPLCARYTRWRSMYVAVLFASRCVGTLRLVLKSSSDVVDDALLFIVIAFDSLNGVYLFWIFLVTEGIYTLWSFNRDEDTRLRAVARAAEESDGGEATSLLQPPPPTGMSPLPTPHSDTSAMGFSPSHFYSSHAAAGGSHGARRRPPDFAMTSFSGLVRSLSLNPSDRRPSRSGSTTASPRR